MAGNDQQLDTLIIPHRRAESKPDLPRERFALWAAVLTVLGHRGTQPMTTREKTFCDGHAVPLDRNAKVRIEVYARAWGARHRQPGQHKGPITRAFMEVLEALLWGFHNSRDGRCFPSYEAIAAKAGCCRSTVYEAIKVLEVAGVLTWQHRITRIREASRDLFGHVQNRWRVIRTSNAYVLNDPLPGAENRPKGGISSKSENPTGTRIQEIQYPAVAPLDPDTPLGRALNRLGAAVEARDRDR